jgi:hypothetical protein
MQLLIARYRFQHKTSSAGKIIRRAERSGIHIRQSYWDSFLYGIQTGSGVKATHIQLLILLLKLVFIPENLLNTYLA